MAVGVIDETIPGLFGGVSQQEPDLRRPEQVEEMVNCITTLTQGTQRRPVLNNTGFQLVADTSDLFTHYYRRDDAEQYVIGINSSGAVSVKDLQGSSYTVNGDLSAYLTTTSLSSLRAITLGDVTYVLNREKEVGTTLVDPSTLDLPDEYNSNTTTKFESKFKNMGYIWLSRSSMDSTNPYTYTAVVNGATYSATNHISSSAASSLASSINGISGFTAVAVGSMIYLHKTDFSTFTLSYNDNFGNGAGYAWKGSVSAVQNLPAIMPWDNVLVEVNGDTGNQFTKYFVKYINGTWVEYTDDYEYPTETTRKLETFTNMPIKIIREADNTFTVTELGSDVKPRLRGNEDNNKTPSFVNNKIQDILFISNRIALLTEDSIVLSEIDEFWNFYLTTLLGVKGSDRIDVKIASEKSLTIEGGVVYRGGVLLQTTEGQYLLNTSRGISPTTISVDKLSVYDYNRMGGSIYDGNSIIFSSDSGNYSTVYRYVTANLATENKGLDITLQIPNYIPNSLEKIVSHPQEGLLFFLPTGSKNLYVYKEVSVESEVLQNAWFTWTFDNILTGVNDKITDLFIHDNKLYIGMKTTNTTYYVMDLSEGAYNSSKVYQDLGTTSFESYIILSRWRPQDDNNVQIPRGRLQIRTLKCSIEGQIQLEIFRPSRNTTKTFDLHNDFKVSVLSDTNDVRLKLQSVDDSAFLINTLNYEGTYRK